MLDNSQKSVTGMNWQETRKPPFLKRILRKLGHSVRGFLLSPKIRYSSSFFALQRYFKYMAYEEVLKTCMEFAKFSAIEGDYLEFGVYVGTSFAASYHFAQRLELGEMRFYAFDSFEGLPSVGGVDADGFRHFEQGEYACDMESFRKLIAQKGVDLSKVELIPGWFDQSLNAETKARLPIKKAAVLYVDCDLYASTVPVLDFITDYVQDGTILIFDDWFCYRAHPERGQQKAFAEWLAKHPEIRATEFYKFGWSGISFLLNRV